MDVPAARVATGGRSHRGEIARLHDRHSCTERLPAIRHASSPHRGGLVTKILVVEDDAPSAAAIKELLEFEGFEVRCAYSAEEAVDSAGSLTPDVVIVDLQLPRMDGRSFVELYRRGVRPAASVIVLSGREDGPAVAATMRADAFIAKPFEFPDLLRAISLTLSAA